VIRRRELKELIEEGENLSCEFKLKFSEPEKIAKEIIAFANTLGGYILFGVEDKGKIVGVQSEKGEEELIRIALRDYITPEIVCEIYAINFDHKEIVVVEIPESKNKPHRIQDYKETLDLHTAQVYVRVNDKSIPAGKEMIRVLRSVASEKPLEKYVIGSIEKQVFTYLEKNETINAEQLKNMANISKRRASRALVNLVRAKMLFIHTKDNGEEFFTSAV